MVGLFDDNRVIAAFSGQSRGNMSLSYGETANSLGNRERFLAELGVDHKDLVCAKQIHSDNIFCVDRSHRGRGALDYGQAIDDCDGLTTDEPGVPLAIFTADCLSVFLYDRKRPAVGVVHAGWRSSQMNIAGSLVKLMRDCFKSRPRDIVAAFGPSISSCCYEVGPDFEAKFEAGLSHKDKKLYLDLVSVNSRQLVKAGIKKENLGGTQGCTYCGTDYFSFRREKNACGRMMSVVMIR